MRNDKYESTFVFEVRCSSSGKSRRAQNDFAAVLPDAVAPPNPGPLKHCETCLTI